MAEAIEEAAVMIFCVSRAYKESANCATTVLITHAATFPRDCICFIRSRCPVCIAIPGRLEAQYAFQRKLPMIPVMIEANYEPDGW